MQIGREPGARSDSQGRESTICYLAEGMVYQSAYKVHRVLPPAADFEPFRIALEIISRDHASMSKEERKAAASLARQPLVSALLVAHTSATPQPFLQADVPMAKPLSRRSSQTSAVTELHPCEIPSFPS
jgi:hypothetical protein